MTAKRSDTLTRLACYIGFVTQAVIINLAPLYFVIFRDTYGISTGRLTLLITVNFLTQLFTDLFAVRFSTRIGLKRCAIGAHIFCALGLMALAFLPRFTALTYSGMLIATVLYSIGGGLLETVINPIFSALPKKRGGIGLSLMHAFYCIGQMAVVLLTTLALALFGESTWWGIALGWSAVPILNTVLLVLSPIREPSEEEARDSLSVAPTATKKDNCHIMYGFVLCLIMILAAGATEQALSQWASYFAEISLSVDKTVGDLLGACLFAFLMAGGRILMGLFGDRFDIRRAILLSALLSLSLYLLASLSKHAVISLAACAATGLAVSILWPSVLDMAGNAYGASPRVFGLLSLFGDLGCMLGPSLAGEVADAVEFTVWGRELAARLGIAVEAVAIRAGILASAVFPLLLILTLLTLMRVTKKKRVTV
ncbi:MAG: MFS transporter [Clostridia bacterium]|nr:MFS transporter [Clostridia bacterium]